MTTDREQAPTRQLVAIRGKPSHGMQMFHADPVERAKQDYVDDEIGELELERRLESILKP